MHHHSEGEPDSVKMRMVSQIDFSPSGRSGSGPLDPRPSPTWLLSCWTRRIPSGTQTGPLSDNWSHLPVISPTRQLQFRMGFCSSPAMLMTDLLGRAPFSSQHTLEGSLLPCFGTCKRCALSGPQQIDRWNNILLPL